MKHSIWCKIHKHASFSKRIHQDKPKSTQDSYLPMYATGDLNKQFLLLRRSPSRQRRDNACILSCNAEALQDKLSCNPEIISRWLSSVQWSSDPIKFWCCALFSLSWESKTKSGYKWYFPQFTVTQAEESQYAIKVTVWMMSSDSWVSGSSPTRPVKTSPEFTKLYI